MAEKPRPEGASQLDRPLPVLSWAMYDFANTIFYAVVATRYLGVHLKELTGRHFVLFYAFFPSMAAAAFLAPALGRWAGAQARSRTAVFVLTVLCCLATTGLGFARSAGALLVLFAFAQAFYQLALVPYNNLLPSVASPSRMGLVSGLGVGVGYAGVLVSLPVAHYAVERFGGEEALAFGPAYLTAGVLFFLFTLPIFLFVPERATVTAEGPLRFRDAMRLMKHKPSRRFVLGNFLCSDALNAVLVLIAVYLESRYRCTGSTLLALLLWFNVSAMISGVLFGFLTDRIEARRAMPFAAVLLLAGVGAAHFSGRLSAAFWMIVLLGGPGVAGLWVAGRKWVVQLAPEGEVGTLFGFYGLSNKLSLVNLALFTWLADRTGGYTASVLVLMGSLVLGTGVLLSVPRVAGEDEAS